jgi:predicted dehydrogenase
VTGTAPATALVIGYGSIGRRHAAHLRHRHPALGIVDGDGAARAAASEAMPEATVAGSLDELPDTWPWAATTAVIATWGPSHAAIFHRLADLGVPRILCEKPLAASVADGDGMLRRAERDGVRLAVHHQRRWSGLIDALRALTTEHGVGPPVGAVVHGGARCLVTNGLHLLDLVCAVFDAAPSRVVSTASGEPINPRSPDLGFFGGTAVWTFDGGRELAMSFTNRSSVSESIRFYHRDAALDLAPDGTVVLSGRDPAAVAAHPAITRTGPATEILHRGPLPGVSDAAATTARILDDLESDAPSGPDPAFALEAVGGCIGALVAGEEGRAVDLPLAPDSVEGRKQWPIS